MKGQTKVSHFIWAIVSSLEHNLELSKFVGTVIDSAPSLIGSKNGMASLLYKYLQKLELTQYYCIIHQQTLMAKVRILKELMIL
jgi:hypothetical protein